MQCPWCGCYSYNFSDACFTAFEIFSVKFTGFIAANTSANASFLLNPAFV